MHAVVHSVHDWCLTCACAGRTMRDVNDLERTRAAQWLRDARGSVSQADLAVDITTTTGWTITRDRYSKYESGSLPFGREVLGHFVDYWATKGKPGPDFTPPAPALSFEERQLALMERQVEALEAANRLAAERNALLVRMLEAQTLSDDRAATLNAALQAELASPEAASTLRALRPQTQPRPTPAE